MDRRARLVLAAMTLDEELSLVSGDAPPADNGTGISACVGHLPAIPRLRIPALCLGDGPSGVGNGMTHVTQFPAPVVGAATWNTALMQQFGAALGAEHAGKGRNVVLAPTINILRVPQWGRAAETLSEDPFLTARLAVAIVGGIQSQGVIATPKHFVANNQETLRLGDAPHYAAIDAIVSQRALHEIYFPAFEAALRTAHAGSVMCAYNQVNSRYACENADLLRTLRHDWSFDGFVVSDWYFAHRSTDAAALAGLDMSMPGGSSPFGFADFYGAPLRASIANGRIPRGVLDAMVLDVLRPMFRLGIMDRAPITTSDADVRSDAHRALALAIAQQGSVLLKNSDAALPLDARIHSIAVIGDDAGANVQTTERYGGFVKSDGIAIEQPLAAITKRAGSAIRVGYARGTLGVDALPTLPASAMRTAHSSNGWTAVWYGTPDFSGRPLATTVTPSVGLEHAPADLPTVWSARWRGVLVPPESGPYRFSLSGSGDIALYIDGRRVALTADEQFTSVTQGLVRLRAGRRVALRVDYAMSPAVSKPAVALGWQPPDTLIEQAVATARRADAAIVFASDSVSEGGDRTNLDLPGDQNALIAAVAAANPRTIVVLHTVGPVLMPWLPHVAAVVAAWYPGEGAAQAITDLLFGDVNAVGKLPMTFPASLSQGPLTTPARFPGVDGKVHYDEGLEVGYRYYDAHAQTPLFPFGFGLSYTTFRFDGLQVARSSAGGVSITGTVANSGTRRGSEVVQVYAGFPRAAGEPPLQLKAFACIDLAAGEQKKFAFELSRADLSVWNEATHAWLRPNGTFAIRVGNSSRNLPLRATIDLNEG